MQNLDAASFSMLAIKLRFAKQRRTARHDLLPQHPQVTAQVGLYLNAVTIAA
jgi:hypothetical protein